MPWLLPTKKSPGAGATGESKPEYRIVDRTRLAALEEDPEEPSYRSGQKIYRPAQPPDVLAQPLSG